MNIQTAKQQIKDAVEAYLKKDEAGLPIISTVHQRPIFLLGAPGIGKTAIMEQIAQELGIGIVSYSMTHHTRQSALGLPRIEHHEFDGISYDASEYTMSEIVASVYDYMKLTGIRQGILFLDEINCVSETLYPSMLQFLQFKTFGKHKVPEGWVVVCAGNPPEYNRSVHEFDIVTLDRLRAIEVEPEYEAWKLYAQEKGLHPAVTTFLEAKKECFYKVESKPGGGKAFVTARAWEDLAQVMALYEEMDKPVNRELFVQFLRDDEIADAFAVYYTLFQKYRSDYQVDSILAGQASGSITERAKQASFDERVALIGLLLDSLARKCNEVLDQESIALSLRDILREVKGEILEGGTQVEEVLGVRISKREAELNRKVASGTMSQNTIKRERLVIASLRDFVTRCMVARVSEGQEAFSLIEKVYKELVGKIQPASQAVSAQIDCAFDFIEKCFSAREMLVFMAELSTRRSTTQFIAHYGNESYYKHNTELQVDSARMGLVERANMLEELKRKIDEAQEAEQDGLISTSSTGSAGALSAPAPSAGAAGLSAGTSISSKKAEAATLRKNLAAHYSNKKFEYGFASVCKMLLPTSELKGKRVLDIGCRRGRGVYKISAMVGNQGSAMGVDWNEAYIAEAQDGMTRAWHDSGLKGNNMEFRLAFPEDLIGAGIGTQTMDILYVNNVMTLFYDQALAIKEFARVLRPGGLLVMETVLADAPRDERVVNAAREMGNSIQAARTKEENWAWLEAAGFAEPSIEDEYEVEASRGYKPGSKVDTVPSSEDVNFKAVSLYVRKK